MSTRIFDSREVLPGFARTQNPESPQKKGTKRLRCDHDWDLDAHDVRSFELLDRPGAPVGTGALVSQYPQSRRWPSPLRGSDPNQPYLYEYGVVASDGRGLGIIFADEPQADAGAVGPLLSSRRARTRRDYDYDHD